MADPATNPPVSEQKPKEKIRKPKRTFMLHDHPTEKNFESLGKYVSTDARYSALKAASKGFKDIYLRPTNTKIVYHYTGDIVELDTPQVVTRGERQITYTKKPAVKFQKKFVFTGDVLRFDDDAEIDVNKKTPAKKQKKEPAEEATVTSEPPTAA